jgi:hypothetical protein
VTEREIKKNSPEQESTSSEADQPDETPPAS